MVRPTEPGSGGTLHVSPTDLTSLAGVSLTSSQGLTDASTGALSGLQLPGLAAGDTPGGPDLVTTHGTLAEQAGLALGHLSSTLEMDMDALYAIAFAMSDLDEGVAGSMQTDTPGVPSDHPGPSPMPTPGPAPTPSPTPAPSPTPMHSPGPAPTPPPTS